MSDLTNLAVAYVLLIGMLVGWTYLVLQRTRRLEERLAAVERLSDGASQDETSPEH